MDGLDGNSLQSAALNLTSHLGNKAIVILGGIPNPENRKLLFVVSLGDDVVRVVNVPGVSMELCGGTHVKTTSELGSFKIISDEGISAGVRRIEALSGQSAFDYFSDRNALVNQLSDLLKANPNQLFERVNNLQAELTIFKLTPTIII